MSTKSILEGVAAATIAGAAAVVGTYVQQPPPPEPIDHPAVVRFEPAPEPIVVFSQDAGEDHASPKLNNAYGW